MPAVDQPVFERKNRNVDTIPGFAYYAKASDILGNLHGGNDLSHAQANLLAGLYMGQLARVIESWGWIYAASIKCRILIEQKGGWTNVTDLVVLQEMLEEWRATLPRIFQWNDYDPPPVDINAARLRAKYYGARYIITRPFLYRAVVEMKPRPDLLMNVDRDPQEMQRSGSNSSGTPSGRSMKLEQTLSTADARTVIEASKVCVQAAMKSTVAFDGFIAVGQRPIVTNIFGTAHAQYGNMLVLAATHNSWLRPLVPREDLVRLLDRTINFLDTLAPISPTMRANVRILRNTKEVIVSGGNTLPRSANSSFTGK
ncbi:hypothetical protein H2199_009247 [Coniosporium tulheliwenetii]|uniref:Uncharacterized protein n=1 Tax=Coniosporium tulheliwenetii TaxID=3383036 RepID=A0ACC2YEE3_9PEZI|nr:hypothetical protein H2199_009247 [Cladosporium sp. JES 115]